jgi:iron complex transport system permease protein
MNKVDFKKKRTRWNLILLLLFFVLIFTVIISSMIGTMGPFGSKIKDTIPFEAAIDIILGKGDFWPDVYSTIILDVRLPRILLAVLVGCALAVAGTTMQGLFKNPMADPFIIGLAPGAAVGASCSILLGLSVGISSYSTPFFAIVGALLTVFVVYNIARSGGRVKVEILLLTGIAVGSFLTAVMSFMMYMGGHQFRFLFFWLLGGLYRASWDTVFITFFVVILGTVIIQLFARDLNAILLGEEPATHLGVNVKTVKKILIICSSLIAGIAVAFTGIIGFVGLIIPHMMRIIVGPDHRILIPVSGLAGGIFLVWADTAARTLISPTEIPVGIITSLCGAPFFIYLLHKSKRGGFVTNVT